MTTSGDAVESRLPARARPLVHAAGRAAGAPFAALARVRGAKSLHPSGTVYDAVLRIDGGPAAPVGADLLRTPAGHPAIVRFSRSLGLPESLPDLFGAAIRLPDVHGPGRHQDFLTVTSLDAPVLHHIFIPVTDAQQTVYSSSLLYRAGGERFLVGLCPVEASPRPSAGSIDEKLAAAAETGRLRFAFAVARPSGRFLPIGELRVGARRPDSENAIRFNPWNTGGGLRPTGVLNALRDYAYPSSQSGWRGGDRDRDRSRGRAAG